MDKTIAGLLGAVGALVAATPGQSAPLQPSSDAVLHANTYSELLRPVPNSLAALRALDQAEAEGQAGVVQVRSVLRELVEGRDDHHHHHNRYYRRRVEHHHHHHHHHHNASVFR